MTQVMLTPTNSCKMLYHRINCCTKNMHALNRLKIVFPVDHKTNEKAKIFTHFFFSKMATALYSAGQPLLRSTRACSHSARTMYFDEIVGAFTQIQECGLSRLFAAMNSLWKRKERGETRLLLYSSEVFTSPQKRQLDSNRTPFM